ncbi:MAG: serine/threonine protein kinase [Myxococcales bacterium]|nr:serine/threonine protein kinase [Myxococcales bacterium]
MTNTPTAVLEPGRRVADYEITRVLCRGGMAVVYEVVHTAFGSSYALKLPDPRLLARCGRSARSQLFTRLRREGRVQSKLDHPNLVRVHNLLDVDGVPALVMDLVRGPTLADLLKRRSQLSWAQIDALGQGMIMGLCAAHDAGVVHRDIKPPNVLVVCVDGRWIPKLADFGLAKELPRAAPPLGEDLTLTGQVMGTLGYMPPEQMLDSKHIHPRADVFALGAVLFELVMGQPICGALRVADASTVQLGLRRLEARGDVPTRMRTAITEALAGRPPVDAHGLLALWRKKPGGAALWRRPATWAASVVIGGLVAAGSVLVALAGVRALLLAVGA